MDNNGIVLTTDHRSNGIHPDGASLRATEPISAERDETDLARGREYALLAALLLDPPDQGMLDQLSRLEGDETPMGSAHGALGKAAAAASLPAVKREYFDLFIGVARGEVVPYASYYLTGFLNDRPLAKLRQELSRLGLERADAQPEPEDHLGSLCEIMSGFAEGLFEVSPAEEERFFVRHLRPWAERCFADIESAEAARFYKAVGRIGRIFMEVEAEAFSLDGTDENRGARASA